MVSLKTLRPHLFYTLVKHQDPSIITQTPPYIFFKLHEFISGVDLFLHSSLPQRRFSTNTQLIFPQESETVRTLKTNKKGKKPLDVLFDEAVGRIRNLKTKKESALMGETKLCSLYSIFTSDPKSSHSMFIESSSCEKESDSDQEEDFDVFKQETHLSSVDLKPILELSPEMILFMHHLYKKGYLRNATFLPSDKLDLSSFSTFSSRTYLRNAAERFATDHNDIAKCLSEDDVKRLALYGCSLAAKETAFAAKRLCSYFSIPEDTVFCPGKLNSSCKFESGPVKVDGLNLKDVMKILTLYALELVPPQLRVPDEIRGSVSKLLKQVVENSSCEEEPIIIKSMMEVSPEMVLLVYRLYEKGYLKDANFFPSDKLDLSCFSTFYSRSYLWSAAKRFGLDHQNMAKCLSERDLKRVAHFGCPCVSKKKAFAAKRLRSYFSIREDDVCKQCVLKRLCTYKYETVPNKTESLNLVDVMKVVTSYSLELVPLQLTVPTEIYDSVNKLLNQAVQHIQ